MDDIKAYRIPIWLILAAILGLFTLYFVRLGSYPLTDPDEPFYGQVAKGMARGDGWLTPHYQNPGDASPQPWFDKPPLFYWASGFCAKVLGPTELACRLPSAILVLALIFVTYALVKHDFGKRAAVLSAVVFATCIHAIVLARAAVTDVTFTTCLLGAIYAYRRWFDSEGRARYGWMALCGAATGLGMLAKGPVAPLLLLLTFVIHLCWTRELKRLVSLDALVGVVLALVVGVPWFAAMYTMNHDAFVNQFIKFHNLDRYTKPLHPGTTGQWYAYFIFVPVFFMFFFPWSVLLPAAMIRFRSVNKGAMLATVWCAVVFIFFSISKTKLVTYIFPTYPMAALFIGVMVDRAMQGESGCERSIKRGLIAGMVMALLFAFALARYVAYRLPDAKFAGFGLGAVLLLMFVIAFLQRRDGARVVWTIGIGMAAFTAMLMLGMIPSASRSMSTRDIVKDIPDGAKIGARLQLLRKPSLIFYLDRWPKQLDKLSDAEAFLKDKAPAWVICRDKDAVALRAEGYAQTTQAGDLFLIANKPAAGSLGAKRYHPASTE